MNEWTTEEKIQHICLDSDISKIEVSDDAPDCVKAAHKLRCERDELVRQKNNVVPDKTYSVPLPS